MREVKGHITVEFKFPKQWAVDLFISACEGGSNYWCKEVEELNDQKPAYEGMLGGFKITWFDELENKTKSKTVTPNMIERGIVTFMGTRHFGDQVSGNFDAITGDVFLQCCAFGEVVYG